ncbi:hypothetical protein XNC1_2282 [Xenorhabdus nematophila ATCC 19061]|uniref:Uncharacterized protein n=1 Tax=Xenorhabdus nematophila (strain ATCC 19061 / DSM 3370 / CCUG 14189 / LMG 1036 / NCIMB 9965 / AN6) TaxID=406817 RepID=D3VFM7_XENNA|nr:hypothetical protein XNC1_2282 [Xenorhabdus nematophila ATCC 19061]CEK23197.1 hypothetical protein XNC2_2203 [Xenorhabdus nematophila AN6/1]
MHHTDMKKDTRQLSKSPKPSFNENIRCSKYSYFFKIYNVLLEVM